MESLVLLLFILILPCNTIEDDKSFNPQPCNKTNHGKIKFFKDRRSNDKLLFCTDDNGLYSWKAIDGSQSKGEFFDPVYDCSDVLNNVIDAKDGFYWINFGISNKPRKVWCDMNTDGGGYMLIGRKRNASMWSVPSNDETVTPFGTPHWTSAFGDAPILDFRVQMATKESFSDTKAHWSFRLKAKRLLKNLLVVGKGGCDQSSAGIGNIAYVKDLQTENIVTTNFQCSKFGFAHRPSLKFGWSMMNSCLQKPCSNGFAFYDHPNIKWQTDTLGAFSYSVTGHVSGIHHDSTAFVGCDNKCCYACYGPLGGTGNYCGNDCQAKPGGTVTKNVYTWFWVRSTLPKRVWSKCMEYQVTADNGDIVWYKLKDGSGVPKKGRCSKNEVLLNDGIAVVSDSAAAKKIPSVPGLLEYRKDNKKLYVRANKTWNVVGEEDKVVNILNTSLSRLETRLENHFSRVETRLDNLVNTDLSRVETELRNVNQTLRKVINAMSDHFSSVILFGRRDFFQQIERWLPVKTPWHLCWRASRDGWAASTFHSRCNNKGATVTIVRVGQYIFGGYNDLSWTGSSSYKSSSSAFVFSLRNKDNLKPFKAPVYRYSGSAIYDSSSYGPIFGGGHDLKIVNNAHSSTSSFSNFGYTYQPPSGYSYGSSNTQALLAGSYRFTPSEVEVFYFG